MKAEAHYQKGQRIAAAQAKLDPATDWESIVEECYMAAHNFVLAGAEWLGVAHQQSHIHRQNIGLVQRSGAPNRCARRGTGSRSCGRATCMGHGRTAPPAQKHGTDSK